MFEIFKIFWCYFRRQLTDFYMNNWNFSYFNFNFYEIQIISFDSKIQH